ncbi:MAG: transposase domain-containing protein [Candidatus Obscuribacterales bacterium]|nr:transposase domain-containing protein [Candidatus Obscuribacterales bacterium]
MAAPLTIESCKRLDINPLEYLKDVLTRFPSSKTSQVVDFLPDTWLVSPDAKASKLNGSSHFA